MRSNLPLSVLLFLLFVACSGVDLIDDYVAPVLRITTPVQSITLGTQFEFQASYFDNVGDRVDNPQLEWKSSNPEILEINSEGIVLPKKAGEVQVIVTLTTSEGSVLNDEIMLTIISNVIINNPEMEEEMEEEMEMEEMMEMETPMENTVSPTINISNGISQITAQSQFQLEVEYRDSSGNIATAPNSTWESSNPSVIEVDQNGVLMALSAGTVTVTVSVQVSNTLIHSINVITVIEPIVIMESSLSGNLETKSSYTLEGSYTLTKTDDALILSLGDDYKASSSLPGLYLYLSNNNNTTSQAYEVGAVSVFNGAHSYQLPSSIGLMDYQYILYWCKPFNVKVGEAKIYD
jgi:hypothetical protein